MNENLRRDNTHMLAADEILWQNVIILSVEDSARRRLRPILELVRRRMPAATGVTVNTKIGVPKTIGSSGRPLTAATIARSVRSRRFSQSLEREVRARVANNPNIPRTIQTRVSTACCALRVGAVTIVTLAPTLGPIDNNQHVKKLLPSGLGPMDKLDSTQQMFVLIIAGVLFMVCCCCCVFCQRKPAAYQEKSQGNGQTLRSQGIEMQSSSRFKQNAGKDVTSAGQGNGGYSRDTQETSRQAEENKKRQRQSVNVSDAPRNSAFGHLNNDYMLAENLFNDDENDKNRQDQPDHEMTLNQRDSESASASMESDLEASSDSGATQVFRQFIENLKRIGFFKNLREGTAEYDKRYMTAKNQFQQQYQSAISPDKPKAAEEAPMSPEMENFPNGGGRWNNDPNPAFGYDYKPTKTEV